MPNYSIEQWLLFFYVYCLVGWIWETSYVSIRTHKFVNRGFMRGPFLPIYGSGAIVMIIAAAPFQGNLILTFLSGMVLASILEYCTGATMEALFKVRYWDYSTQPFNINGHVCLFCSLGWGLFTVLHSYFLHPFVEKYVLQIPAAAISYISILITIGFAADFALAFRAALDLRDIIIRMEKEMQRMQKRADVMIAYTQDDIKQRTNRLTETLEAGKEAASAKLEAGKEAVAAKLEEEAEKHPVAAEVLSEASEKVSDMVGVMDAKWDAFRATAAEKLKGRPGRFVSVYPDMVSKKFAEALEQVKKAAEDRDRKE